MFSLDDISLGSLYPANYFEKNPPMSLKPTGAFWVPLVNYELPLRNVLMRFASFLEKLSLSFTVFTMRICFQSSRSAVSEQSDLDVYFCIEKL
jgi:hypothetical protein